MNNAIRLTAERANELVVSYADRFGDDFVVAMRMGIMAAASRMEADIKTADGTILVSNGGLEYPFSTVVVYRPLESMAKRREEILLVIPDHPVLEIAKSVSYPWFSVLVDGKWDCDCANNSEEVALAAARELYPDSEVIMWDDPRHYSNR